MFIFLLVKETGLVLDKRLFLVSLSFNLLPAIELIKTRGMGFLGGACILLLGFFNFVHPRARPDFRQPEVLL